MGSKREKGKLRKRVNQIRCYFHYSFLLLLSFPLKIVRGIELKRPFLFFLSTEKGKLEWREVGMTKGKRWTWNESEGKRKCLSTLIWVELTRNLHHSFPHLCSSLPPAKEGRFSLPEPTGILWEGGKESENLVTNWNEVPFLSFLVAAFFDFSLFQSSFLPFSSFSFSSSFPSVSFPSSYILVEKIERKCHARAFSLLIKNTPVSELSPTKFLISSLLFEFHTCDNFFSLLSNFTAEKEREKENEVIKHWYRIVHIPFIFFLSALSIRSKSAKRSSSSE